MIRKSVKRFSLRQTRSVCARSCSNQEQGATSRKPSLSGLRSVQFLPASSFTLAGGPDAVAARFAWHRAKPGCSQHVPIWISGSARDGAASNALSSIAVTALCSPVAPGNRSITRRRPLRARLHHARPSDPRSLPEPDCEFRAVRQGTVDTEEFARLKLAYERQCYQRAERAARRRLQELQASRTCEGKPPARRPPSLPLVTQTHPGSGTLLPYVHHPDAPKFSVT